VGGGGNSSTPAIPVGQFIDAPVAGLNYVCGSYSGTTNASGQFNYSPGSTCKFFVGNVQVGSLSSIPSDGIVTPHDVAGVSRTANNDPNVIAIAQFLQSIGNSNAGVITIPDSARQNLQNAPPNTAIFTSSGPLSQSALGNLVIQAAPTKTLIDPNVAKTSMTLEIQQRGVNTSIGVVPAGTPISMSAISVNLAPGTQNVTSLAKGLSWQLQTMANFTDGTTTVITNSVTYSSSDTSIATVNSTGLVTGVSAGTASITVTAAGGKTNTISIPVTPALLTSIVVTPSSSSVAKGLTQKMVVTGSYTDGTTNVIDSSTVNWSSSNTSVATVSSAGLVSVIATGGTTISATSGSISGSTVLTGSPAVLQSIVVTTANSISSSPIGISVQLTATGNYSDGSTANLTNSVSWLANNNASISSTGLFTGITSGVSVPVTASYQGITSSVNSIALTDPPILQSIAITATTSSNSPIASQAPAGYYQNLVATGTYSNGTSQVITTSGTWTSASQNIATVTSGALGGRVTGVSQGTSVITVTKDGISKSVTFTVTAPVLVSISVTAPSSKNVVGATQQLVATGTYSDNTTSDVTNTVTWSTSNSAVTVSSSGLLTTVNNISTPISISVSLNGVTSSSNPTVTTLSKVGGIISGLSGTVVLKNNGGDSLSISANGAFNFATPVPFGSTYSITIGTQPAGYTCSIAAGSGTVSSSNIGNINVTCVVNFAINTQPSNQSVNAGQTAQFSVTASGLNLTYQWYKNGSAISGATNSSYTTPSTTSLDNNSSYYVSVTDSTRGTLTSNSATLTVVYTTLSNLQISEVSTCYYYNDTCWFEIYNPTSTPINLSGYQIKSTSVNYVSGGSTNPQTTFTLPAFVVPATGYIIVTGNTLGLTQRGSQIIPLNSGNLVPFWNANGFIELLDNSGNSLDFVRFGTSTQNPTTQSAWIGDAVPALASSPTNYGKSIVRMYPYNSYTDTNTNTDWTSVDWSTPGGRNDVPAGILDADGDGIPDSAEVSGGTFAGIDLYSMGARTNQKDIFIEVDYMNSTDLGIIPRLDALQMVVNQFATKNISIHFDTGTQFSSSFSTANFNLGQGSNVVPYEPCVTMDQNTCNLNTSSRRSIYDWKIDNMDLKRRNIFHYALFGNSQLASGAGTGYTGLGELGGNDFIISNGSYSSYATTGQGLNLLINHQAATVMHELGHNLNLQHGGFESTNNKPNYYSIMNYTYALNGLDPNPNSITAYQRWRNSNGDNTPNFCNLQNSSCGNPSNFIMNYSDGTSIDLDENALYEANNIGRGSLNGAYADWDLNGFKTPTSVSRDLNGDGQKTVLKDYNDWGNLVFPFTRNSQNGQFGPKINQVSNKTPVGINPILNDRQPWADETLKLPSFGNK
jgi:uncharacterized protein YjdB